MLLDGRRALRILDDHVEALIAQPRTQLRAEAQAPRHRLRSGPVSGDEQIDITAAGVIDEPRAEQPRHRAEMPQAGLADDLALGGGQAYGAWVVATGVGRAVPAHLFKGLSSPCGIRPWQAPLVVALTVPLVWRC